MDSDNAGTPLACPFCGDVVSRQAVAIMGSVIALPDKFPVTPGHLLIIPIRHTLDFFSMTREEHQDAQSLLEKLRHQIVDSDPTVDGFNIGANCGKSAGQTIDHAHIHLIPRRSGDTSKPDGGVRGVIPARMHYNQ
jgi:diadenosine tetraphosphate (Ap4A) HIT family hydrolase